MVLVIEYENGGRNYNLIYHSNSFIIVILQILIASLQYATEGPRALASLIYKTVNPN